MRQEKPHWRNGVTRTTHSVTRVTFWVVEVSKWSGQWWEREKSSSIHWGPVIFQNCTSARGQVYREAYNFKCCLDIFGSHRPPESWPWILLSSDVPFPSRKGSPSSYFPDHPPSTQSSTEQASVPCQTEKLLKQATSSCRNQGTHYTPSYRKAPASTLSLTATLCGPIWQVVSSSLSICG